MRVRAVRHAGIRLASIGLEPIPVYECDVLVLPPDGCEHLLPVIVQGTRWPSQLEPCTPTEDEVYLWSVATLAR